MAKILVLEDEEDIREFVIINLKRAGYQTVGADRGKDALEIIEKDEGIDLALLDLMLPDISGFEVCRKVRETNKKIGIIMLTAKSQENDKINGLINGADDYITKPFSPAELVARIDALLRRVGDSQEIKEELLSGRFVLNERSRIFYKDAEEVRLTQIEYMIIEYFLKNPDIALSRDDVLNAGWGKNYFGDPKIVDVNIRRLRKKIEDDPSEPKYIQTVWGYGYKWVNGDA